VPLLSLEDNARMVYHEAAKKAILYTPILYVPSEKGAGSIEAAGSGIFFRRDGHLLLLTAGHCIKQNGQIIKTGVLDGREFHRLQGEAMVVPGGENKIDLGIVRLSKPSKEVCLRNYAFLDDTQRVNNRGITGEPAYLVVGHPISKVSIDHRKKSIKTEPFAYVAQSTEAFKLEKYNFLQAQHLALGFDRRRSTVMGSNIMSYSPYPQGISGCGVWYIPDYFIDDAQVVQPKLAAIIIEYYENHRVLIATKFDVVDYLLRIFVTGKEPL